MDQKCGRPQLVKTPKVYLNDNGLLHYLIGQEGSTFLEQRANAGPFLQNFVVMEIIKQLSWSALSLKPYHFSIHKGSEVDLVLEDQHGGLFGIESNPQPVCATTISIACYDWQK